MSRRTKCFAAAMFTGAMMAAVPSHSEAALIGTVGPTTTGSITVNGTTTYTVSNFTMLNSSASGGGVTPYQGADINVDLATGGGNTVLLTFSKNAAGPTPGVVFLANPGNTLGYTFSYDLAVTPAVPGTVNYTTMSNSLTDSHLNNGLTTLQTIVTPTSIHSFTGSPDASAPLTGQPTTINVGNIHTLTGNSGNVGVLNYTNTFNATFVPVPEPSSIAMIGIGAVASLKRRKRTPRARVTSRCET